MIHAITTLSQQKASKRTFNIFLFYIMYTNDLKGLLSRRDLKENKGDVEINAASELLKIL